VSRLLAHLEGRRALGWPERRLHALAALVAYTGLRLSEALCARVEDLDLGRRVIWVSPRRRLKTEASAAAVPIAGELAPILEAWLPHAGSAWLVPGVRREGPWRGGAPGYRPLDRLQQAAARIGLEGVTFHGLRHTLATLLVQRWGRSAEQVSWVLRHASPRTTVEHYIHADELATLAAVIAPVSYR
jgi:integrase